MIPLGTWPTPLEPAPRLARAVGLAPDDLWIKRDDLTGLGGGGNKVRKLQRICRSALADGVDTLVTCGAAQSNHARLTAAAGARLGLRVVLVLAGPPDQRLPGNLALDALVGAEIEWAGPFDAAALAATAAATADRLAEAGARPLVVPYGGSSVEGARGYVDGGQEILEQAPTVATVVTAVGSGGTMAGLVHALGADRVLGVDCGAVADPAGTVAGLLAGLAAGLAGEPGGDGPRAGGEPGGGGPRAAELQLARDQVGAGYATLTEPVADALALAGRTEGIVLDPVYTGRALAGLVAAVASGRLEAGRRTVLLHSGGLPGLFGHPGAMARWPGPDVGA